MLVYPTKSIGIASKYNNINDINIKVNYPESLSYKTKKDIFDLRKKYIADSIFANPNYEPSDNVFGLIEENKPWLPDNLCEKPGINKHGINGPSEEARFIKNSTQKVMEFQNFIHLGTACGHPEGCNNG